MAETSKPSAPPAKPVVKGKGENILASKPPVVAPAESKPAAVIDTPKVEASKPDVAPVKVEAVATPAPAEPVKPVATAPVAAPPQAKFVAQAKPAPVAPKPAPAPKAIKPVAAPKFVSPTVPTTPPSTPAAPAAVISKEVHIMEATINNTAEKTQAMFSDVNGRAKAALEKSAATLEQITEFGKGNVEAFVESGKIAAKGLETIGQQTAEYTRQSFEGATAAMKSLSSVKTPMDFFKMQSDFLRQSFDSMVAHTSKNTEAMLKLAGEVSQPISNRVAVAVEKVKQAA